MFFARVRWVGRILEGAEIDTSSETGRVLSTAILKFSKYCQAKNRRGEGAHGVPYGLGPAEWAVLGAIFAPEETRLSDQLAETLGLSHSDAAALVARVRNSAIQLAEQEFPELLRKLDGG